MSKQDDKQIARFIKTLFPRSKIVRDACFYATATPKQIWRRIENKMKRVLKKKFDL